jgi:hypothetical protein
MEVKKTSIYRVPAMSQVEKTFFFDREKEDGLGKLRIKLNRNSFICSLPTYLPTRLSGNSDSEEGTDQTVGYSLLIKRCTMSGILNNSDTLKNSRGKKEVIEKSIKQKSVRPPHGVV